MRDIEGRTSQGACRAGRAGGSSGGGGLRGWPAVLVVAAWCLAACGAQTSQTTPEETESESRRDPPRVGTDIDEVTPSFDAAPVRDGGARDAAPSPRADAAKAVAVVSTPTDDCGALVDKMIALITAELGGSSVGDLAKERDKMIEECRKKPPTAEERACLMRAEKMNDILGCLGPR